MRLILVEHGGECIRGDSAIFATQSPEWAENTFQEVSVAKLAVIAARLLDESEGYFRWNYQFSSFGPSERGVGYDIFVCPEDLDEATPDWFREVSNVVCRCFYMGFVRCLKPVIPFNLSRVLNTTKSEQPAPECFGNRQNEDVPLSADRREKSPKRRKASCGFASERDAPMTKTACTR